MPTQLCCGKCGIDFSVPDAFYRDRRDNGETFYCPNGHPRVFLEPTVDVLRRERDRLQQRIAQVIDEKNDEIKKREAVERREKRLKKRTAAGTCPCCQRTFSNMSTHMRKQHPAFVAEQINNVVPLKKA